MIKLNQLVIVEGKYDKITLENVIDAHIISTEGFCIFKNKEKCDMIRRIAEKNGVIIMTDSDSAGSMIRAYIKKIVGNSEIINVYVPALKGKEKRKNTPSKEGFLGVEGMSREIILQALQKSGVTQPQKIKAGRKITKTDLFCMGLSGNENSSQKREWLLENLDLPKKLSPNAMLDVLNDLYTYEQFLEVAKNVETGRTKD